MPQCINTQLLEGMRVLFLQISRVPTTQVVDVAAAKRRMCEVADQPESFVAPHHFLVVIVSFNGVGEQRVLLFQEEWPQQPYERRSLERARVSVCVDLWLPCVFRKHTALA